MTDLAQPESTAPQDPYAAPPMPMAGRSPVAAGGPGAAAVTKRGAWGLWWMCMLTFGIYYFVWYGRMNRELCALLGQEVPGNGKAWSQLIPIFNWIGLMNTAKRLNAAHAMLGSSTQVSPFVAGFLAPMWFASQTRYLQRRMNTLHDVLAAR